MAQQRPYPITLDERRLATQLSRSPSPPGRSLKGQEEPFPPPRLSGLCRFRKRSLACPRRLLGQVRTKLSLLPAHSHG
jgi:hypothetical protein